MIKRVSYETTTFNELPWKFEAGTSNIADAIALGVVDATAAASADLLSRERLFAGETVQKTLLIACALLLDLPAVGCAKSILTGKHGPVGEAPGDWAPLVDRGETVGAALRTRAGVSPVYVSVGLRCALPSAIALVRRCAGPTRVPETTRQAHLYVNALRRGDRLP